MNVQVEKWEWKYVTLGWESGDDGVVYLFPPEVAFAGMNLLIEYMRSGKRRNDIFSFSILSDIVDNAKNGERTWVLAEQVGEIMSELNEVSKYFQSLCQTKKQPSVTG
jgi:hypothetical protein